MFKKKSLRIIGICTFCALVAAIVCLAGVSFAKYIISFETETDKASVAEMNCTYTLEKDGFTFVNAPFEQQIGSSSGPVQMNAYSTTLVEVKNEGNNTGISYSYSFAIYIPMQFAKHSLLQVLRLNGTKIENASKLYSLGTEDGKISPTVSTLQNEYASLASSENGKLDLKFSTQTTSIETTYTRTFSAFPYKGEYKGKVLCPFSIKKTEQIEFCKLVISLDATKYFLNEGETHSFEIRVVPETEMPSEEISQEWEAAEYEVQKPTTTAKGYDLTMNDDGTIDVDYVDKDGNLIEYKDIYVSECIGVTFPSRVSVIFTQRSK